jgi:tetratricopeptide (TPR) repeat protein
MRAGAYMKKGNYDSAITDYTEAIRLDPRNTYGYSWRGQAHEKQGNVKAACADYKKALELESQNYFAKEMRDYIAKHRITTSTKDDSKNIESYVTKGGEYFNRREYDKAIAKYTQAIQLNPQNDYAYRWRTKAHERKGNIKAACIDYQRALEIAPKHYAAREMYNYIRKHCGEE